MQGWETATAEELEHIPKPSTDADSREASQEEKSHTGDFSPSPKENKSSDSPEKGSTHRTIITKARPSSRTSQLFVLGITQITPRPVPSSVLGVSIIHLMTISASDTRGPR